MTTTIAQQCMTIRPAYEKYSHLDGALSEVSADFRGQILHDLWQAIKSAATHGLHESDPTPDPDAIMQVYARIIRTAQGYSSENDQPPKDRWEQGYNTGASEALLTAAEWLAAAINDARTPR